MTGMDAFELVDKIAVGWNLGNTLDSNTADITFDSTPAKAVTSWGNEEPTLELFETVKAAGFNAVRIPITWYQHVKYDEATDGYVINDEWMAYVKKVVDYAYYLDLIVIIDTHCEIWYCNEKYTNETYENATKMIQTIWGRLSEEFADYDQGLIFEGMNEPEEYDIGEDIEWGTGTAEGREYINNLNQVFVDVVRAQGSKANKERALLLPTYAASAQTKALEDFRVPDNAGNVIMSVHAYWPYSFARTGNPLNSHYPGSSVDYGGDYESDVNELFDKLERISGEKNIPIIIGEFAATDNENNEDRVRWVTHYLTRAKEAGIACFWWDNQNVSFAPGDEFGLLHRKSGGWYTNAIPVVQAMMSVYGQECILSTYEFPKRDGFSWDKIPVEKEWEAIFYSNTGKKLSDWEGMRLNNLEKYMDGNYEFVVVYDSEWYPNLVFDSNWYLVPAGGLSTNAYMLTFSMKDIYYAMDRERVVLEDMEEFFVTATDRSMVLYAVYAVPVKK